MFKTLSRVLTAFLMTVLCLPVAFANEPGFTDEPGTRVTVRNAQGIAVLTYEYAEVLGEDGKVSFDTAKVFYHVVGPDGEQMLTKGPGGRFPHHRGIYIGWNNLRHNGQRHDLWHVRNTQQKHQAFTRQETTDAGTTIASRIQWIGTDGAPVLEEVRTVTVHHETGDAYAVIDFTSELTAAYGDVQLSGDPEHAGIQFRASQEVAENKSATYVFPVDEPKDQQYTGMPWAALTFQVDGQKWTVQQMAYPGNPEGNARWSAYRDYGRFGQFPTYQIEEGQRITLQYRFRVTPGEAPDRAGLNEAYEAYAE